MERINKLFEKQMEYKKYFDKFEEKKHLNAEKFKEIMNKCVQQDKIKNQKDSF